MSGSSGQIQGQEGHAAHSLKPYAYVFTALLALTALTVSLSYVDVGAVMGRLVGGTWGHGANIVAGLIVALVKASLVVWIFMHQDHEEGVNRFILGFSIGLMTLAFLAFSSDFVWLGTYTHKVAGMLVAGN
jgi:caa(3)-type oxidase subunit IV